MLKVCNNCRIAKDISDFGRNAFNNDRGACDGLNINCKVCVRQKVSAQRQRVREYKKARGIIGNLRRKSCHKSIPIWRLEIPSREKVLMCYQKGITDRHEIKRNTRLGWDELGEIMCELSHVRLIKFDHKTRVFRAVA